MYKFLLLILLIGLTNCNRQRYEERLERKGKIKCGWYGKLSTQEQRTKFPFNKAHKVVIVSFPDYENDGLVTRKKDSVITPWGEFLGFNEFSEQPKVQITRPILDTLKLFKRTYSVYEKVQLNLNQVDSLSNLMLNYKKNRQLRYGKIEWGCCYRPRNAIIFYDKNDKPFYNLEICFECSMKAIYSYEDTFQECFDFELYRDFFKNCHIRYGVDSLRKIYK